MGGNCCCDKCAKACAWLMVLLAVLFVLQDTSRWDVWGLNWWTLVACYLALGKLGGMNCKACQLAKKKR